MIYTKESAYGANGRVYAGMFYTTTPNTFPATSDDVPDLADGYKFETGSYVYVVQTGKIYMYDADTDEWIEQ